MSTAPAAPTSVRRDDVVTPDLRDRLTGWVRTAVARLGDDPSWYRPVGAVSGDPLDLDGELRQSITAAIAELVPAVERELGVPHVPFGAIDLVVWVDHPAGSVHGPPHVAHDAAGGRWIDFVWRLDEGAADSIVFFPSSVHHDLVAGDGPDSNAVRVSLRGWVTTAPVEARTEPPPHDPVERRTELQCRLLPRFSAAGFEVRPMPTAVHDLLRALLELRGGRRRPEDADRYYHLGDDNDFVDITDLTAEVLDALRPLHEQFSGVPLVPTALYGLRSYRAGARLAMHVDRVETHVVSSVLQVAQDVDECWPLQLRLGGRTHDVLLSPGQMLLYEGASTMHGRVTPLQGRSFVNAFAHYRPVDWDWTESMLLALAGSEGG